MDMAFLRRAERMLADREPARLDHSVLIALLAAQQAAAAAGQAGSPAGGRCAPAREDDPLIEILLGGPRWRQASAAQRGCFSRAEAGRRVNGL
jgi:hypothetical protein